MNTIPAEVVENTWLDINSMSALEAPKLVNRMSSEQPIILNYLLAIGENFFNQDEKELLLYLGLVIWQIMSQGDTPPPTVTEEMIDEAEDANLKMLEFLGNEPEAEFIDTIGVMFENYNQPEILRYIIEALMEEPDEEIDIRTEIKGVMMIYLKTIIDCFDK